MTEWLLVALLILVANAVLVLMRLEQYCAEGPTLTYNAVERDGKNRTQGGYSNKIVVDENYVLRIPENIPMARAAPASLRRYHALFASYALESRSWKESRYYRSRRPGTHGSKNRSCTWSRSHSAQSLA